jgi:2-succinyl-5-enolpyruvyl-6-hydroxy-3-cyclohexene-1-carboxylate synthase
VQHTNRNYAVSVAFVRALAAVGLRHVVITPGSRSTPLTLAFASEESITDWSHHDERAAAFFALGIAKTTGFPAAVVCTSGTAAAEYLPAIVEARHARVPLLVLTADRPPELRDVGAPQAVDQVKLYGDAVKWFHQVGVPDRDGVLARTMPALSARAVQETLAVPEGPVHLNFEFREPLTPEEVPGDVPANLTPAEPPRWFPPATTATDAALDEAAALLGGKRTIVVAGETTTTDLPAHLGDLGAAAGFPIMGDALSGMRRGSHDRSAVVDRGYLLASAGYLDRQPPEAVLRIGAIPTAKPAWRWLELHPDVPQVLLDTSGWRDPTASASLVVHGNSAAALVALRDRLEPAPAGWLERWRQADAAAGVAIDETLDDAGFPTEPGVARLLGRALPDDAVLYVASSMPVRDVDAYVPGGNDRLRILSNRGANGIDGFLSSGLGAAATSGRPTYLLAGDLSALHDLTALAFAAREAVPATIVVLNNDGGGIFHFLPQVDFPEHFERHFGTPHGLDFVALASPFGVPALRVTSADALATAVAAPTTGPRLIEVRTGREGNAALHYRVRAAVAAAIGG